MKDVYVLRRFRGPIFLIADTRERCSEEMAKFPADRQELLAIENYNLHEDGD